MKGKELKILKTIVAKFWNLCRLEISK